MIGTTALSLQRSTIEAIRSFTLVEGRSATASELLLEEGVAVRQPAAGPSVWAESSNCFFGWSGWRLPETTATPEQGKANDGL